MAYNLIPRETQVSKITTTGKTTLEGAATGYIPYAAVGDLTGDDLPEVVISGWSFVDQLSFYETPNIDFVIVSQRQDGSWSDITSSFSNLPLVQGVGSIEIADFNLDGVNDVFFSPYMELSPEGKVWAFPAYFLLSKNGDYEWSLKKTEGSTAAHSSSLADIDGDGVPEVLIGSYWNPPIDAPLGENIQPGYYQFNSKTENFDYVVLNALFAVSGIAGGDLNGDGRTDVIATDQHFNSKVDVIGLLQSSERSFTSSPVISESLIPIGSGYFDVYPELAESSSSYSSRITHSTRAFALDVDKDGDLDVITTGQIFGDHGIDQGPKAALSVFENQGGEFYEATNKFIPHQVFDHYGAYHLAQMDINNDGHMDLISYAHGSYSDHVSALQILLNNGLDRYYEVNPKIFEDAYKGQVIPMTANTWSPSPENGLAVPVVANEEFSLVVTRGYYENSETIVHDLYSMKFGRLSTGPSGSDPAMRGAAGFNELYYLTQHDDVAQAVAAGAYSSGLDHYLQYGKDGGRAAFAPGTKIRGSDGVDKVSYLENKNECPIALVNDGLEVQRGSSKDHLIKIERLAFKDVAVAFDIVGNAGTAAKILAALWGKESVENPTFVGIVLHYLDSGVSYEALLDLALGAILRENKTNEAIVELVFTNLVGEAPTQDAKTELASYMDSGAYSQAGFARAIADLELNATNINLVGLSDTGLQYTEYVP